jgi:uncharacterized protein involved in exopolysaccharide biosynthesis
MNQSEDEFNLLDYWHIVWKGRKLILAISLASVVAAAVISLLMTPIYQAKTTLMPVESSQGRLAAAMGALQNISLVGGAMGASLGKTATDKLITILSSRTIAEEVIHKLGLMKIVYKDKWDPDKGKWKTDKPPSFQDALRVLQNGIVRVTEDRKGLISIIVEYENPDLTARIANEYTAALQRFLNSNAVSLAKRNRIFLQAQLSENKTDLQRAEEELKTYQTKKKILAVNTQAEGLVRSLAELKAQVIAREVQLGAMREMATKDHPDIKRMEDELRELRLQLKRLESGSKDPKAVESAGSMIPLSEAPALGLGFARLKRDALIQEKVFELLIQQYELAKIEEAREEPAFQIIDPAVPPEKRIKPRRTQNVFMAGLLSVMGGVLLVIVRDKQRGKSKKSEGLA